MKKRLLSLFLAVWMIVGMIPAQAFAGNTEPVSASFRAVDINTQNPVAGATLQIINTNNGYIVDEWTSTEDVHTYSEIEPNAEYVLRVTSAPEGYTIPSDTTFAINEDGTVNHTGLTDENGVMLAELEPVPEYAAMVGEQGYMSLTEALKNVNEENNTLKLLKSMKRSSALEINKDMTLDLNGYTLKGGSDMDYVLLIAGSNVNIIDSGDDGKIESTKDGSAAIMVTGGTLTVEDGIIKGVDCGVGVYSGECVVTGGIFSHDPSEFVDKSAYSVTEQDGMWVVSEGGSTEPTPPEGEEQTKDYELVVTDVKKVAVDADGNAVFDADGNVVFDAESVSAAESGDILVVTVGIKNNTKDSIYPVNFDLKMYYDSDMVTPYTLFDDGWDGKVIWKDFFSTSYMSAANAYNDEFIRMATATNKTKGDKVAGGTTKDIFYLAFQVNSDAAEGTAQFWFDQNEPQSEFNQNDGSGDDVSIDVYGGDPASVAISKPAYAAEVGGKGYMTLADAYAAVNETNNTITLLKDVTLSSALEVTKKVTIDLNGNTISSTGSVFEAELGSELTITGDGSVSTGGRYGVYVCNGTVNITSGTVKNTNDYGYGVYVTTGGKLNISGGSVEVNNIGVYVEGTGTANITGGSVSGDFCGVYVELGGECKISDDANIEGWCGAYAGENGKLNISGGTVSGDYCVYVYGSNAKATISGGYVSGGSYGVIVDGGRAEIKGGTIESTGVIAAMSGGTAEVTGGRFNKNPSQYVDTALYQVTFDDNWYVVSEKPQADYVAMVGTQGYESLQAAYDAVNDTNNTITLLKDIDLGDNYLEIGKKVTIDLGGYDVSSAVYAFHIEEGGELTVTGEGTVSGSSYGAFVDGGTVNIESGNISGGTYGVRVYDGTVNIKDGSVEATGSYSNGVYGQGNSFVNIEGGEVSGSTYGVNVVGGKATISGGTVSGFYGAFVDNGKCEIAGGTVSGSERGVYVTGVNNSELKISGGEVSGGLYGVYVYGSNARADISGGSVLGGIYGVVAQEDCTVNIESGTVSGDDVVAVYGGKVNISGGTVTATSRYGAGVIAFDGKLTISGGEVSGADGVYIEYNGDGNTEVTITGGTVSGTDSGVDAYGGTINVSENANISGGNSGVYVAGGKLDIAGGTVKATGSHSYGVYGYGNSVVNIEGGEISGVNSGVGFYGGESISGKVNVSENANISGGRYGVNITNAEAIISGGYVSGEYGVIVDGGKAEITGGTIEATSVDGEVIAIMSGGEAEATGGRFNKHPMYFVPDTHQVTFEDGWYVVSKVTKYNITVGTTVNGTVEVDKTSAKAGEIVTVTVTPMPGYELTNLSYKKNGMSIGIMGNSFAMPTGDVEIVATFKALPTYRIVMPSTFKGGTVTVDDKEAYAGQEVTVTAAANEGYELVFVSVMTAKGTQITLTDGKFTMPAEVVMIAAAFKEKVSYVAQVGEQKFESLQAAIDAAEDGDEIVLLSDITLTADDTMVIDGSIIGVFVTDKNIALDMNGKTISVDLTGMTGTIIPFATVRDGHLTINDTVGSGKITATGAKAYALFSAYNPASKLTINGGAFELAEAADCLIHANANEAVVVNGGTFTLDNVGTGNNYQPWIFNVNGKNASHVIVNGGTYNSDVNHQFWGNEVMVPETLAVKDNGDGTWTVTEAEAYIVEIGTSQHSAERKIGYATLAAAIASVEKNAPETTIVLLKDVKVSGQYIGHSYAQKIVLDLNGKTLSSADRTLNIHRGGTEVLIKNGTVTGNTSAGTIQISGGAKLTLENATIKSGSKAKAIKINKDGTLVINDASVKVQGGLDDLIVETGAQTLISAGTFNHDVSDYCVEEYGAVKNTDGTYTVKRVILVENVTTGVKYKTVADAIKDIAKNAGVQELKLLGDVTVKGQFIGHSYAQQVVIDLNGFKMSSTDKALTVYRAGTEVTIKNGTVHGNSTGGTIQVTYGGKLTLGENVTITSGGSANALKVDSPATLIIDNDTVKVQGGKNDLIVAGGAKVEISAGYFKHPVAEAWCAEGKMPNPVKTADGWYTVMDAGAAVINGKAYETLHDAFAAVKNGETIKVMKNIDLANEETVTLAEQYKTYFKVEGKSVTIDLNGKTISGTAGNADNMLVGVFSTENDGHLTITGEGTVDVQDGGKVYALIVNYEDGCSIVIENGTYKLDAASDSLIYCGAGYAEGTEGILVQDGTFHLGNLGKGPNGNGSPWIFNVYHKNQNHIMVNGGTFNADVNHQFWANEVFVPETLALKDNDNGTWTVVEAAGYVVEIGVSQHSRERKVGYVDLAAFEGEDVLGNKDGEYFVTGAGSLKQFAEEVGGEVKLENSNIAMTEDITVAENKELLMESDSKIAFNGGGNTITANGTGTKAGESYDYGYVGFIPANKEAATVENVTVTGSGFVEVGHHGTSMGGDYTINNLTVKDLIATLAINNGGNNIAAAFSHYGNAEMTDCVMTGTTTLKEGFKAYDAAFVNTTKTVMSGCTFGKIYLANQAHVTITNTVIDVIDSYAISTRNLGKLVIGAGAEIGVINLYDTGSYKATLVIEEGANVGAIVYNGVTYTAAEWMAR